MGSPLWQFSGEVALVTGTGSGIGHETARALCAAGARVHGLDLSPTGPEGLGSGYVHHAVDLTDRGTVALDVEALIADEGRLDHLVLAAGITGDRAHWNLDLDTWDKVLDVNVNAAFRLLKIVAPHMRAAGRGQVVAVTSINGMRGKFGQAAYGASKAALINLMHVAARELGPKGVRVNCVAPGMIDTPMAQAAGEEVIARAKQASCLGRIGQPAEITQTILFLLSESSSLVTGTTLVADAGQMA